MPVARKKKSFTLGDLFKLIANLKTTQIIYVLLLIAAFLIGYLLARVQILEKGSAGTAGTPTAAAPQQGQPAAINLTLDQVKNAFNKTVIKFGKADAKTIVIEKADPSCPYCHAAAGKNPELAKQMGPQFTSVAEGGTYIAPVPELKKLLDEGKISYAYLYSPGHGNGEMGMKAFYCAYDNGKFWEVHDLLMTNNGYELLNNEIKNDKTKSQEMADFLASAISSTTMKNCLDSGKYDNRPQEETAIGNEIGASGTPTYYINESQQVGAQSFDQFKSLIK